jgi:hypothetical protein
VNQPEFNALRTTFPWTERVFGTPKGGIVQVIDRNGHEVPLFTMTKFLTFITTRLALATEAATPPQPAQAETTEGSQPA